MISLACNLKKVNNIQEIKIKLIVGKTKNNIGINLSSIRLSKITILDHTGRFQYWWEMVLLMLPREGNGVQSLSVFLLGRVKNWNNLKVAERIKKWTWYCDANYTAIKSNALNVSYNRKHVMKSEESCENDVFIIYSLCDYKPTYIKTICLHGYTCKKMHVNVF